LRRAAQLFGGYVAVIAAVIVAGFLGTKFGIWAAILWGVILVAAVIAYLRQRTAS
jgi:hypothetical protein